MPERQGPHPQRLSLSLTGPLARRMGRVPPRLPGRLAHRPRVAPGVNRPREAGRSG
ncbi:hypothetical protein SGPA1_40424 [Streptomyces misionensis JCM 4497]